MKTNILKSIKEVKLIENKETEKKNQNEKEKEKNI